MSLSMNRPSERGMKRKRECGVEKHHDESRTSFTSKESGHSTNDQDCSKCKTIVNGMKTSQDVLSMHVDIRSICPSAPKKRKEQGKPQKDDRKNKEKERIYQHICALRNSKGGILLIYFTNMDGNDKSLGLFDELVDDRLNELIEDGVLFNETYFRDWLKGVPNCLSITCNPSSTISTVNYNTHINLNKGFARPTVLNMRHILRNDRSGGEYEPKSLDQLQEATNLQLKSFPQAGVVRNDWARYIMEELRLRKYMSSFANQKGGGYYFLGVSEYTIHNYNSKKVSIAGFKLKKECHETLKSEILEQIASKVLFLSPERDLNTSKESKFVEGDQVVVNHSLKFTFHEVEGHEDIYVLEVYVSSLNGVVFFDRSGPESFLLKENNCIQRVEPQEWCQKVLKHPAK